MDNSSEYKWNGLELTPAIFIKLLIELFDGKQFDRTTAINTIVEYHKEHGGLTQKPDYVAVFKAASGKLKKQGMESVGYGTWRLSYDNEGPVEVVEKKGKLEEVSFSADKEIGEGAFAVYVYFFDSYKELAEKKNEDMWECKIGRTDVDPVSRVFGQAGTCFPEYPHLALIIHCKDSALLEDALHNILKIRGRWISGSPGKEWFYTSPKEVEELYNTISFPK